MYDLIIRAGIYLTAMVVTILLVGMCTSCVPLRKQPVAGFDSHVQACADACKTGSIIQFGSCKCVLYGVDKP